MNEVCSEWVRVTPRERCGVWVGVGSYPKGEVCSVGGWWELPQVSGVVWVCSYTKGEVQRMLDTITCTHFC